MAAPLSFLMVKTGGFASPDFSGFAPCFMVHTLTNHRGRPKRARLMRAAETGGAKTQTNGQNQTMNGRCTPAEPGTKFISNATSMLLHRERLPHGTGIEHDNARGNRSDTAPVVPSVNHLGQ